MLNLLNPARFKDKSVLKKPVYINIFTFAFPITAIVSILHRITGVFIFLLIPVFLNLLQDALYYPWVTNTTSSVLLWFLLSAFVYHLIAGIRHLCMDVGFGEAKATARITSYIVLALSVLFSILIGLRLC